MPDAAYYREYRRRRKAAGRPVDAGRDRRRCVRHEDRTEEYRRAWQREVASRVPNEPLPLLFPHLQHGTAVSFWQDELRMDLHQERALALIEGRNPDDAEQTYRTRELAWWTFAAPLLEYAA